VDLGQGVTAGFTLRRGGLSLPPWDELNLGVNVADDAAHVAANRHLAAGLLGAPVAFSTQVHGSDVYVLTAADAAQWGSLTPPESVGQADAMLAAADRLDEHPIGLGVLVADCVPVLFADAEAGVVAVAHAGRQGVLLNVVAATVAAIESAGGACSNLRAAVGPAVCGRCYEVPSDMQAQVVAAVPEAAASTRQGTSSLDLPAAVIAQLHLCGITDVQHVDCCTMEDDRFFSHRRASRRGTTTGRQAGLVAMNGAAL
jgi:YfiH family protein